LHVRAHQRAVGIVVLQERDKGRRYPDDLLGRDIDILYVLAIHHPHFALGPGQHQAIRQAFGHRAVAVTQNIRRSEDGFHLLVGPQGRHVVENPAAFDLPIHRRQKTILIDSGIDAQRADQPDVVAFRRLDGANPPVVADMHVADFEPGPLAIQTARAQGRKPPLVG